MSKSFSRTALARLAPAGWANLASRSRWILAPHLAVINRYLLELAARRIRLLMIHMPPQHGKSMLVSQYLPGWWLGTFKHDRVILSSYEAGFAAEWGGKVRDSIEEYGADVFGIRLRADSTAKNRWDIVDASGARKYEGGMVTAGVGGGITGRGANLFIMDDPIKDYLQANSRTYRNRAWDWWQSTALTRVRPDGVVILMMTRWHEDDLAGRILRETPQDWMVLSMPAIAEKDETLGDPVTGEPIWTRRKDEALWPERYARSVLVQRRARISSYWWNAVFQQRPVPPEGNIFKRAWFLYYTVERHGEETYYVLHGDPTNAFKGTKRWKVSDCWTFQTCDPAATSKDIADWFVLSTWAVTPEKDLILLDVLRDHIETTNHEKTMREAFLRWRPKFQGVERESYGLNIIQACKKSGLPVRPLPAEGDKVARARTMAARYEVGAVYHPRTAPWVKTWEEELVDFNSGEHDDQVDTAAYAGIVLVQDIGIEEEAEVVVEVL